MERITERYFTPSPSNSIFAPSVLDKHYNKKQAKFLYKHYFKPKYKFDQVFDQVTVYNDGTVERLYTE